ncbi:MAG: hypothetical protein Sapg2KO_10910 [Saprospiraceae bacterium]
MKINPNLFLFIFHLILLPNLALGQVCNSDNSPNLIPDGDFGSGSENLSSNSGNFESDLVFTIDAPPLDGFYVFTNNTSNWTGFASEFWINIQDNSTDPNGYMMVINQGERELIYEQNLDLCGGLYYNFTFDAINLYKPSKLGDTLPRLQIWANDELIADLGRLPKDSSWYNFDASFTAQDGQNTIQIRSPLTNVPGNDYALDNITLKLCTPNLTISPSDETPRCPEEGITLLLANNQDSVSIIFQLQLSIDNGSSWSNIGSPTFNKNFNINRLPPNARYRVLAAQNMTQLFNTGCRFTSEVYTINYADPRTCNEVIGSIGELCNGTRGDNIFEDGDFGSGSNNVALNPRLAPGYLYQSSPPPNDGFYTITNNTSSWGSFAGDFWVNTGDNSDDPNGYMMVVNASVSPGIFYEKTVPICESTNYEFSADIINMNLPITPFPTIKPNVSFLINGQEVFETGDIPEDGNWNTYGFTFTTRPGVSAITLTLRNNAPGGNGNDLAIDNISFRPCGPKAVLPDSALVCAGSQEIRLTPELEVNTSLSSVALQWQRRIEGTINWLDIPGEMDSTLLVNNPIGGDAYRLKLANRAENLGDFTCQFFSNTTILNLQNTTSIVDTICQGDTLRIGNIDLTTQNLHQITFPTGAVCDSIVQVDLTVHPSYDLATEQVLCIGDTLLFGSDLLTIPGDYTFQFQTNKGCDSLIDLTLIEEPTYNFVDTTILCFGEGFQGKIFFEDEVISAFFQSQEGCDSILSTYFKILPSQNQTFVELVCPGETFNGNVVNQDTLVSVGGFNGITCDSVTLYELQLFEDPEPTIQGDTLLCAEESTELLVPGFTQYNWSTGDTSTSISVEEAGTFQVNLVSENNCLYEAIFEVEKINLDAEITMQDASCFGNQDGLVDISSITGVVTGTRIILNGVDQNGRRRLSELAPGNYELIIEEPRGCQFKTTFDIGQPDPFELRASPQNEIINLGDSLVLNAFANRPIANIAWSPAEVLNCTDCLQPTAAPVNSTLFEVTAMDAAGCSAQSALSITVDKTLSFYAPNAFSPNNDGNNDFFTLYPSNTVLEIEHFQIVDRWGNLVKEVRNVVPGSSELEWDGTQRGSPANSGIYLWKAAVRFKDNQVLTYGGDVLLIR